MNDRPFILALTGSIGMGKSTTAEMFRGLDVPVWDADKIVQKLYAKDGAAVATIGEIFPEAIKDGTVSKEALKKLISADPEALSRIEKIVHPLVALDREKFLEDHTLEKLVVLDIPLLFETGGETKVDAVLVVTAPADVQKDRVLQRGTMSELTFEEILSRQMPDAEKRQKADYVIETLTLDDTRAKVRELVGKLTEQR